MRSVSRRGYLLGLALSLPMCLPGLLHAASGKPLSEYTPKMSEEFKALLRQATPEQGAQIFERKCSSCHDAEKNGGHGKGPHLWNVVGRKAGSAPGFDGYSEAMKSSGHVWTLDALNYYLTRTDVAVPGRVMNFRGIRRDKVRARLLRFLHSLSDNPAPLP